MRPDYVDLDRTFIDFAKDAADDEATTDWQSFLQLSSETRWPHLLKSRAAVVLAEAGSGKTARLGKWRQRRNVDRLKVNLRSLSGSIA